MSVNSDLYTALVALGTTYDTKIDDQHDYSTPALCFSLVSDVPDIPINGPIAGHEQRWQVSVYAQDLTAARTLRESVITALHGLKASSVRYCEFESSQELFEDGVPQLYHIPIDFMVYC